MRFSSIGVALLVAAWGCAHTSATPPFPTTPAPVSKVSSAGGAERSVSSAGAATVPVALDPTEAITARELASIPDPIPGHEERSPGGGAGKAPAPSDSDVTVNPPAAVPATHPAPLRAATGDGRHWVWRVQVFASPDLTLATRIANEASARFGEPFVIEFEGGLYKVRLGAFASEGLAQALRERAVQGGFPGAFRMRSPEPTLSSSP